MNKIFEFLNSFSMQYIQCIITMLLYLSGACEYCANDNTVSLDLGIDLATQYLRTGVMHVKILLLVVTSSQIFIYTQYIF